MSPTDLEPVEGSLGGGKAWADWMMDSGSSKGTGVPS